MTKLYGAGVFLFGVAAVAFVSLCGYEVFRNEISGKIKHGRPAGLSDEDVFDEY